MEERVAARVIKERAGNGDGVGNCDEWNGDTDGTMSSGSIDSKQVKTVLLAAGSQLTCYRSKVQGNSSPVLSWPPTNHAECLYRPARCGRGHGMLKIKQINNKSISQMPEVATTHLQCLHVTQPHRNLSTSVNPHLGPIRFVYFYRCIYL